MLYPWDTRCKDCVLTASESKTQPVQAQQSAFVLQTVPTQAIRLGPHGIQHEAAPRWTLEVSELCIVWKSFFQRCLMHPSYLCDGRYQLSNEIGLTQHLRKMFVLQTSRGLMLHCQLYVPIRLLAMRD